MKTAFDLKRNPHKWTEYESAQKQLRFNKLGIYFVGLLIAHFLFILVFLSEYFRLRMPKTRKNLVLETWMGQKRLKPRGFLLIITLILALIEGILISVYWSKITQEGVKSFSGFPFGKSRSTLICINLRKVLYSAFRLFAF